MALHTWIWVARDVIELEPGHAWDLWTGALGASAGGLPEMPGTTSDDLGLGLLQLAAVFAAFTGAWTAGGLMAATAALTFAYRLQVIWHAVLHSESSPFYAVRGFFDDSSVEAAAASCAWTAFLSLVLMIVLLAGIRPWPRTPAAPPFPAQGPGGPAGGRPGQQSFPPPVPPQPEPPLPGESPQRPTGAHAAVAALFLGALAAFNVGWNFSLLSQSDGAMWVRCFTGKGTVYSLLDVAPAWEWLTLLALCAVGAVLAMARVVSARGFSLGMALALLPGAVTALYAHLDAGTLLELGGTSPVMGFFSRAQLAVVLLGGMALLVLSLRQGVPAVPAGTTGPPGAAGMPFAPQPYFPAQPGPGPAYGCPAQPGQPPTPPPAGPDGPGGGFGPPPVV